MLCNVLVLLLHVSTSFYSSPYQLLCTVGLMVKKTEVNDWVMLVDDCVREIPTPRLVEAVTRIRKLTGMKHAKV